MGDTAFLGLSALKLAPFLAPHPRVGSRPRDFVRAYGWCPSRRGGRKPAWASALAA